VKNTAKTQTPAFFKTLQLIGIIGLTLLVVNFIYQILHRSANNPQKTVNALCDLQQGPCSKILNTGGMFTLNITPRPIKPNTPLYIQVKLTDLQPQAVSLFLFPVGSTQPAASPILLSAQSDGEYSGQASINDTNGTQQSWVAMVNINLGEQQISAPFRFEIGGQ
jgi:hypothetical protein